MRKHQPGVCSLGPAEIVRRGRAGHAGALSDAVHSAILAAAVVEPQSTVPGTDRSRRTGLQEAVSGARRLQLP